MYLGLIDINKVLNIFTRLQFIGIKRGEIKGSFVKVTQTSNTLSIKNKSLHVLSTTAALFTALGCSIAQSASATNNFKQSCSFIQYVSAFISQYNRKTAENMVLGIAQGRITHILQVIIHKTRDNLM